MSPDSVARVVVIRDRRWVAPLLRPLCLTLFMVARPRPETHRSPPQYSCSVVIPARNEVDLDDVPENVREEMTFHIAASIDEVLAVALEA